MGDPSGSPFFIGATMFNIHEKHTLSGDLMHETRTQDVTNLLMRVGQQVGIGEGRPDSKNSAGMGWGTFNVE